MRDEEWVTVKIDHHDDHMYEMLEDSFDNKAMCLDAETDIEQRSNYDV